MSKRVLLGIILGLGLGLSVALAACDGDEDKDDGEKPETVTPHTPTPDETQEADDAVDLSDYEPGLYFTPSTGLTLLAESKGEREGTGYFFAQVRNDTDGTLSRVEGQMILLDEDDYALEKITFRSLLGADIPPGHALTIGTSFPVPERYVDAEIWLVYETEAPNARGTYGLPVSVDYAGPGDETAPYVARGSVQNNSAQEFFLVVVEVALIGPDDQVVGLGYWQPPGAVAAGESVPFEASINFVAADPETVREAVITAVGYAPLE